MPPVPRKNIDFFPENTSATYPANLRFVMVIPGAERILLGAIPLEGMDLMVNPVSQELAGVHGDEVLFMI